MAITPPTSSTARDFSTALSDIEYRLTAIEVGLRTGQLGNSSLENSGLNAYDNNGNLRYTVGLQSDGNYASISMNNPNPPPIPNIPNAVGGIASFLVTYDGGTQDGIGLPTDWSHANVYIAPPSMTWTKVGSIMAKDGTGTFTVAPAEYVQYSVRLTNVNFSGKESDPGGITQVTPTQVVGQDLIDGIVTETKLASDAVTAAKIAADAVGTAHLQNNSVTLSQLADGSVDATAIIDGAVQAGKIAAEAVGTNELAANSIVAGKIATDAIESRHVTASSIIAGKLAVDSVQAGNIVSEAVTASKIAALTITGDRIAANAITAGKIQAGSVTAAKLEADMVIATRIIAGSATGARVEIHPTAGIQAFLSDGATRTVWIDAATGNITATGSFQTAFEGQRIVFNPGGSLPDQINFYPSGGGDFGRLFTRTAPGDGSAALLLDGGAGSGTARGRIGVYKGEAFISNVSGDTGGDTSSGFSTTAVSCTPTLINVWARTQLWFWKVNSSNAQVSGSLMGLFWSSGDAGTGATPTISANNAGIKLDVDFVCVVTGTGTAFGAIKATAFTVTSGQDTKQDIQPIEKIFNPLRAHRAATGRAFKYREDVGRLGKGARRRFGVLAEEVPEELVRLSPAADGSGPQKSLDLADMVGWQHAALNQHADETDARFDALEARLAALENG